MSYAEHLRPETLLPLVRAAWQRGEGPAAVLAWMRNQNRGRGYDESRARVLAGRLAETLARRTDGRTRMVAETH